MSGHELEAEGGERAKNRKAKPRGNSYLQWMNFECNTSSCPRARDCDCLRGGTMIPARLARLV